MGLYFWVKATQQHAPASDRLILIALALAATVWLLYENIRDTDLQHGIRGSCPQLALFFPRAVCSLPLLLVAMIVMVVASYKGGPALFIDR